MASGCTGGQVVAAHVGNQIRRQYAVVGDPVNVGSRLCGQAGAGEVVVSEAVLDRAGGPLAVEPLGPLPLKGKRQPVRAFRVTASTPAPDGAPADR
jgi:adenylate cyclase